MQWKAGITAIAMAPNDVWSIISPSREWRKPKPGQVHSTISFTLASFDSAGGTVHQMGFTLDSSPYVNGSDYMSPVSPLISLQVGPGSGAFSVLWRESTRSSSTLRISTFDTATGECLCNRLVLSESSPHLGNRVFVNIPAEARICFRTSHQPRI